MTDDYGPGFYLLDGAGRVVAWAPESVDGPGFSLSADRAEDRDEPGSHGWRWYEDWRTANLVPE